MVSHLSSLTWFLNPEPITDGKTKSSRGELELPPYSISNKYFLNLFLKVTVFTKERGISWAFWGLLDAESELSLMLGSLLKHLQSSQFEFAGMWKPADKWSPDSVHFTVPLIDSCRALLADILCHLCALWGWMYLDIGRTLTLVPSLWSKSFYGKESRWNLWNFHTGPPLC